MKNHDLSICIFFALILLFWFAKKKRNKSKSKKQNKCQKMQMDKSIFSHFFPFLTFLFFPIYFASGFCSFEGLVFDCPCVFFFRLHFFSSLKIFRISYRGEHKFWPKHTESDIISEPQPFFCLRSPRFNDIIRRFQLEDKAGFIWLVTVSPISMGHPQSTNFENDQCLWVKGPKSLKKVDPISDMRKSYRHQQLLSFFFWSRQSWQHGSPKFRTLQCQVPLLKRQLMRTGLGVASNMVKTCQKGIMPGGCCFFFLMQFCRLWQLKNASSKWAMAQIDPNLQIEVRHWPV